MKKLLLLICTAGNLLVPAQSISFGADVMPKRNFLTGGGSEIITDSQKPQFIVVDRVDDSLGFFFTKFRANNSMELPVYLRFKTKNRWSYDVSYSLSRFSLEASGITTYVGNFYEKYYPRQSYENYLNSNGYYAPATNTDSMYNSYIETKKDYWTDNFSYTEDCKIRSFGFNALYRFLPHKAYKPYVQAGFVYRKKVSSYYFQNFSIENTWINDVAKVSEGMTKFSESMFFFRFGSGVETYRFKAGILVDIAAAGSSTESYTPNSRIVARKTERPYNSVISLGFYIGADLFNYDLASKKQNLESGTGVTEVPKVKIKNDKWSLGARISNPVTYNISGYYSDKVPLNVLSLKSTYDPDINAYPNYLSFISLKGISLVENKPRPEAFLRVNFLKKLSAEGYMGFNILKVDFATTEARALEVYDTTNWTSSFNYDTKYTKMYSGVFRKSWTNLNFGLGLNYDVVSKDLFKLRLSAGTTFNFLVDNAFETSQKDNVNSTDLAYDFNEWMELGAPSTMTSLKSGSDLFFVESSISPDVYGTPTDFYSNFSDDKLQVIPLEQYAQFYDGYYPRFKSKETAKSFYMAFRVGAEVEFNRFLLGMSYEANLGYMQGVLLRKYNSFSLSLGYLILKK